MITTKDLLEFMKCRQAEYSMIELYQEYCTEIVARLKERDEFKAGIENMIKQICRDVNIARKSKGIDE